MSGFRKPYNILASRNKSESSFRVILVFIIGTLKCAALFYVLIGRAVNRKSRIL